MSVISERIKEIDPPRVRNIFADIIKEYTEPAFGAMSKREFDILLFMKLQELGILGKNPEIYAIVSLLKVTRAKARNLLYEAKLRSASPEKLDEELKLLIKNAIFIKDNDKIAIEVGNPFLIDHLKAELKKLGYITDSSFSPELVKLSPDAFVALLNRVIDVKNKSKIEKTFKKMGMKADLSFNGILKGVLKKLGSKFADKAGEELGEVLGDYLEPIIDGSISLIKEKFNVIINSDE